MINYGKEL